MLSADDDLCLDKVAEWLVEGPSMGIGCERVGTVSHPDDPL